MATAWKAVEVLTMLRPWRWASGYAGDSGVIIAQLAKEQ